jgi:hypothetical protein
MVNEASLDPRPAAPGEPPAAVAGGEAASAGARSGPRLGWARAVLTGAVGAALAGAYAHFVGCKTGTCPITANVWTASLYGLGVGLAVGWPARASR